jgi:hypothetical protein
MMEEEVNSLTPVMLPVGLDFRFLVGIAIFTGRSSLFLYFDRSLIGGDGSHSVLCLPLLWSAARNSLLLALLALVVVEAS